MDKPRQAIRGQEPVSKLWGVQGAHHRRLISVPDRPPLVAVNDTVYLRDKGVTGLWRDPSQVSQGLDRVVKKVREERHRHFDHVRGSPQVIWHVSLGQDLLAQGVE